MIDKLLTLESKSLDDGYIPQSLRNRLVEIFDIRKDANQHVMEWSEKTGTTSHASSLIVRPGIDDELAKVLQWIKT